QYYDPTDANAECRPRTGYPGVLYRCILLAGSGDLVNDTLEYWLGGFLVNTAAGVTDDGGIFDAFGTDTPLDGLEWSFNGEGSAANHNNADSYIATGGILPKATYPQFESWAAAKYSRPGGPFDPKSGARYAYS